MTKLLTTFSAVIAVQLVVVSAALANDGGEGWYGEANDKVVTFFGLGLIILFPLIAAIGSVLQGRLERRKEERTAAIDRSRTR